MGSPVATTAATPASGAAPAPSPFVSFTPILVVCAILYFLVIRPQQKQAKEHKRMVDTLKPGDRVLTQGGIFGSVVNLKGNTVVVKIAENVKVEVTRSAISQVIKETANGAPTTTPEVVG
jgi:preprotein translocase subunit YajC